MRQEAGRSSIECEESVPVVIGHLPAGLRMQGGLHLLHASLEQGHGLPQNPI